MIYLLAVFIPPLALVLNGSRSGRPQPGPDRALHLLGADLSDAVSDSSIHAVVAIAMSATPASTASW